MRNGSISVLWLALLSACATSTVAVDGRNGESVDVSTIADRLHNADVVVIGEEHDSPEGHRLERRLLEELHQRHPDLILSMEMFERDVQGVLDDYLAGRIGEQTFSEQARPWPHYDESYRPLIEFARAHDVPVVAANIPRSLAQRAAREGVGAVQGGPDVAKETSAPHDDYYRRFVAAMTEDDSEPGEGAHEEGGEPAAAEPPAWITAFYAAQCLKDDTMAESIVDALHAAREAGRDPLVVHVCGKFHCDYGEGTVARIRQRAPDIDVAVVSMQSMPPDPDDVPGEGPVADYVLHVPKPAGRDEQPGGHPAPEPPHHPAEPAAPEHQPDATPSGGRPALNFMPDYGYNGVGVGIAEILPGGAADKAGLRAGDVVVMVAGRPVTDMQDYMAALSDLEIGKTIDVVVDRDGEEHTVSLTVGSR